MIQESGAQGGHRIVVWLIGVLVAISIPIVAVVMSAVRDYIRMREDLKHHQKSNKQQIGA